ncbi:MAG TPA: HGxxPAAW family protein [Jiangellaceae bacterium]
MAYNSHGHTPAGWTAVILVFAGFVVGGIAVIAQNWPLFWVGGVGVVVIGGIVGKVMQMMGLGQGERPGQAHASSPAASAAVGEGSEG